MPLAHRFSRRLLPATVAAAVLIAAPAARARIDPLDVPQATRKRAEVDVPPAALQLTLPNSEKWSAQPQDFYHKYFVNLPARIHPGTSMQLTVPGKLKFPDGPIDGISTFLIGVRWHF